MKAMINKIRAFGRALAPPSKSMAHRYLICGALSKESVINGVEFSEDIKATLGCLYNLGANVSAEKDTVTIGGLDLKNLRSNILNCNESGSTLRFLIPLCLLTDKEITLTGSDRLFERSLSVYEEICTSQGILFKKGKNSITLKGKLQSGRYSVRGDISSQFISGLIFALSLLEEDSVIDITTEPQSGSYLSLTIKALADFGVRVRRTDENTILIKGSQSYKQRNLSVEGDYSNAAFLDFLNYFGSNIAVEGLKEDSVQGDRVYKKYFEALDKGNCKIDISDCPDLGPILFSFAAAKNGGIFTGTKRLRIKESDRIESMRTELSKLGIEMTAADDSVEIKKGDLIPPKATLYGFNDHRVVMALTVLASLTGGEIEGIEAVKKSYPTFFQEIMSLGIDIKVI